MKIIGAYFSPSGGTQRAVELVCGLFGDYETLNLGGRERAQRQFQGDELLVLGLPVYAGQIPAVQGLLDGLSGENTPCVLLAAYGNRHYDDALAQMKQQMGEKGFRCLGAATVITPHIFAPSLGMGRPDEEDEAVLKEFVRKVQEKLARESWEEAAVPGNPSPAPKKAVPVPKDRDWDTCLGCAICAKACPTGAMDLSSLLWDDAKCISCMACVSACPTGALGFSAAQLAEKLTANFTARRPIETFVEG